MLLWVLEWREGGREGGLEGGFILSFHSFVTLLLLLSCGDSAVDQATFFSASFLQLLSSSSCHFRIWQLHMP